MISLKVKPTFRKTVEIPVPGDGAEPLRIAFDFKHMKKGDFDAFRSPERQKEREGKTDGDLVLEVATAWYDVDLPFSKEGLDEFCQNFHGAGYAVITTYIAELSQAKSGN